MTTKFENDVHKQLYDNSIVFLKDGIERLVNNDNGDVDLIKHDLLTLTCTSFQISIELAIKALIIERKGIKSIIETRYHSLTDNEIEKLFTDNVLKTLEFDMQKNYIKSQNFIEDLTKEEFKIIDEFQKYRNRVVHFAYNFNNADLYDLKYDIIYYLIHIIFKILLSKKHQDEKPSEFIQFTLGSDLHKKLIKYRPYINAMEMLARENSSKVFKCIVCLNKTFSQEEDYCYCCNFLSDEFTLIDCDFCSVKKSVIYDNLNIEFNDYTAKGLCLNCDNDGIIFECPKCGIAHNMETRFENVCNSEGCINEED